MRTIEEKETSRLIKKYHTMIGQAGLDKDEKQEFLLQMTGKQSSKECSYKELMEVCSMLERMINPKVKEADYWRKRCLSACGKYVEALGKDKNNLNYVKAVICRSAKVKQSEFNRIPTHKLQALYNSFNYMARSFKRVMDDAENVINDKIEINK